MIYVRIITFKNHKYIMKNMNINLDIHNHIYIYINKLYVMDSTFIALSSLCLFLLIQFYQQFKIENYVP